MNTHLQSIVVTSKDGIQFAVATASPQHAAYDRAYAAKTLSTELAKNSDFTQVKSLDDLLGPEEYLYEAPRISSPLERRAAFKVIKGGKAS